MKSSNPNSGCNQVTVAPTLDTWSPDPSLNQGGIAIVQTTQPTVIVFAPGPMVRFGGNIWEGIVPTLRAESHRGDAEPHILIIDGTRVDDVRVYEGPVQTLKERMGTGGNNVPIIAFGIDGYNQTISDGVYHTIDARTHKGDDLVVVNNNEESVLAFDGYNQSVTEDIYRALRIGIDSGDCIAIPIQDGREMEKKQNGLGIGSEGDPSYTLDQTGAQAVAIQGTIIGRADHNGPQGSGVGQPGAPMYTLDSVSQHGVEHNMQVRRLTPVECERLMGWPDNHTLPRTDGKQNPDTTRYKMCGNGVASPVAQWIGQNLMEIMGGQ
jgi:hypothetical protein